MSKILVTGGAGFIGSHLCEKLLSEGHEVLSLDNINDFYNPQIKFANITAIESHPNGDKFKSYIGDIRDTKEVNILFEKEKPDAVIHLAAMAGVRPSLENPALYIDVNIAGTQVLLDACVTKGIHHFLFASSSSVYGNNAKVPFSETDCVDFPISPYAMTKKAGELLCHTYAHLYEMKIHCLRFFTVYGPRQRPDLAIHKFAKMILQDEEVPMFGDGSTRRDYTYVADTVDGIYKTLLLNMSKHSRDFEILNLGHSRTVSLAEMIHALERALCTKAKIKQLPLMPGDVQTTFADVAKAKELIGYDPKTSFDDGIAKFVDWVYQTELLVQK